MTVAELIECLKGQDQWRQVYFTDTENGDCRIDNVLSNMDVYDRIDNEYTEGVLLSDK